MKTYRNTYVIGDLQGCFAALKALLKEIKFDPEQDFIYFAGDLVARGEDSLSCLRFVKKLCDQGAAATVLGNHDLTLIACARGLKAFKAKDQTENIVDALDGSDLIDWLRHQPLLIEIDEKHVLTHAGMPHIWSLEQAKKYAKEVESVLQADLDALDHFLANMYGALPDLWSEDLTGVERLRVITNTFTRMRLSAANGQLEFSFKESLDDPMPLNFSPWFKYENPLTQTHQIIFGHWAALQGVDIHPCIISVDGGCVWGGNLIAYHLESRQKHLVFNPLA